ncbi:MAG TPA: VCBS repeat-containing protein [Spirochaetota bacterium]|nr:VCBS repeat-containing protein [Spirochaetota bacterium]
MKKIFLICLLLTCLHAYHKINLNLNFKITSKVITDINNDKHKDLFIIYQGNEKHLQYYAAIYLYKNKTYKKVLTTPIADASAFDLADLNGNGIKDFYFIKNRSVFVRFIYSKNNTFYMQQAYMLINYPSLLSFPVFNNIINYNFVLDLNNDNQPDIVLPYYKGFRIFINKNKKYIKKQILNCNLGAVASPFQHTSNLFQRNAILYNINLPVINITDYNRDNIKDIIIINQNDINVFLQQKDKFISTPVIIQIPQAQDNNLIQNGSLKALDFINKDNYLDIICQYMYKNDKTISSKLIVYQGPALKKKNNSQLYKAQKLYVFKEKGLFISFPPIIEDINNDQLPDMRTFFIKISFIKALTAMWSKSTRASLKTMLQQKNNRFYMNTISDTKFEIDIKYEKPFIASIVNVRGDFNGDRISDILIGHIDNQKVEIFKGRKNGNYSDTPMYTVSNPLYITHNVLDINNNRQDDLIMFSSATGKIAAVIF